MTQPPNVIYVERKRGGCAGCLSLIVGAVALLIVVSVVMAVFGLGKSKPNPNYVPVSPTALPCSTNPGYGCDASK